MLAERQRLSLYTRFLPKIVVCGEEIPSEFKSHKNQKIVLLQQVYSKEKKKKNTFVLLFKSGPYRDLCDPTSLLSFEDVDTVCSFFYFERLREKDHMLNLLAVLSCILKPGGYFIGMAFDAIEVLLAFAHDLQGKFIDIPRETRTKCALHLLDGKDNLATLSSHKIPYGSEFSLLLPEVEKTHLPHPCILLDWKSFEKHVLRFGFRLVESHLICPAPGFPAICRSYVFQFFENRFL